MIVRKALVIGLGSTGTRICNYLAERLEWELGSINAAPFVQFLCIETDQGEPCRVSSRGDFKTISLSSEDFKLYINNPEQFADTVLAGSWADMGALRLLPEQKVEDGAGNIRMVGRLAFLHPPNNNALKQAIVTRLETLENLRGETVTNAQISRADGTVKDLQLADADAEVFVVGTLCGGTGSGIASDFGYFVRSCNAEATAIFTLPNANLSQAMARDAERYKKNAYTALLELNHYSCVDHADNLRSIRFADDSRSSPGAMPFDTVFLTRPDTTTGEGEKMLNRTIGEYLFLRVFADKPDLTNQVLDPSRTLYKGFCTFGFATLEFPAAKVMDACSCRLLAEALRSWRQPVHNEVEVERALSELGIDWGQLSDSVYRKGAPELSAAIESSRGDVGKLCRTSARKARETVARIRDAFEGHGAGQEYLSPGSVPRILLDQIGPVSSMLAANLHRVVQDRLPNVNFGPTGLQSVVAAAVKQLNSHAEEAAVPVEKKASDVDRLIGEIGTLQENGLVRFYGLHRIEIDRLAGNLAKALGEELAIRQRNALLKILQDGHSGAEARPRPGILSSIRERYIKLDTRLGKLGHRVLDFLNTLEATHLSIASVAPNIKGKVLFEGGDKTTGTVALEYGKHLKRNDAEDLSHAEARHYPDVLASWAEVVDKLVPTVELGRDEDFFLKDYNKALEPNPLPDGIVDSLRKAAARPFATIAHEDVLARWNQSNEYDQNRKKTIIEDVLSQSEPLLSVSTALAQPAQRSHILRKDASTHTREFDDIIRATSSVAERKLSDSPDSFRAVVITHILSFPLTAVPEIAHDGGLIDASPSDRWNFHSRVDISWHELPRMGNAQELNAAGLVATALLLGIVNMERGKLTFKATSTALGEEQMIELPGSLLKAGSNLEREALDENARPTKGFIKLLQARLNEIRSGIDAASDHERDRTFIGMVRNALRDKIGATVGDYEEIVTLATSYLARDVGFRRAIIAQFPIDEAIVRQLMRRPGEKLVTGGPVNREGLYCTNCGGWIGADRDEAERNGWTCTERGCYFGPDLGPA